MLSDSLPFSLGLAPFGILLPLARTFHSSTFSIELMESSDTSITDCWYSLGVSALMVMVASAMPLPGPPPPPPGVGVTLGMGVGPPSVPYMDCVPPPVSRCLAYVESA